MVRLSDILKKKMQPPASSGEVKSKEKERPPKEEPSQKQDAQVLPSESTIQIAKAMAKGESPEQKSEDMQIAKAMRETQPDIEHSRNLYSQGIRLVKELLINYSETKPVEVKSIKDFVAEVVDCLVLGDKTLLLLFCDDYPPEEYLNNHMVNVMIMSLVLGLELGYNKSRLNEFGVGALMHDVGMNSVKEIALKHQRLSNEEFSQIKKHPDYGADFLSRTEGLPQMVITTVREVHERINGEGYPKGLKGEEICEYSRIITTVDVYEALTHSRTYRKKYSPHEAIKEILALDTAYFDPAILKVLVNRVGLYPIGSWAELNTSEIAKVIASNPNFPLRPVANIIFDAHKKRLEEPRLVNLAKQFNIYIKGPLSDKDISALIKE